MRAFKTALGAGVAALGVVGVCGIALAQGPQTHLMTVTLPDGGVAQIRYAGPVAPRVTVSDAPAPIFASLPALLGAPSPFAEFERVSAAMDREADRMFREATALAAGGAQPNLTAISAMPAGSSEYSFVSTVNGGSVCSRSMVVTSRGDGAAPKVVTHTSGNCATAAAPGTQVPTQVPTQLPAASAPANGPRMIMTRAVTPHHAARLAEASLN